MRFIFVFDTLSIFNHGRPMSVTRAAYLFRNARLFNNTRPSTLCLNELPRGKIQCRWRSGPRAPSTRLAEWAARPRAVTPESEPEQNHVTPEIGSPRDSLGQSDQNDRDSLRTYVDEHPEWQRLKLGITIAAKTGNRKSDDIGYFLVTALDLKIKSRLSDTEFDRYLRRKPLLCPCIRNSKARFSIPDDSAPRTS